MKLLPLLSLLALCLVLVLSFGCAQKPDSVVQEPPLTVPAENNSTVAAAQPCSAGNVVQKDDCFGKLAYDKADPEYCKSIYSVEKLDSCYALFANSSLEICKKITNSDMRAACLTENAIKAKSEDACSLIGNADKKLLCLKSVLPECMLILDPEKRTLCLALEKNDYTVCQNDDCFEKYAENKSDANACSLIKADASRFACLAIVKRDAHECQKAEFSPVMDLCVKTASIALEDLGSCDIATSGSDYRNGCYLYFAIKGNDVNICKLAAPEFSIGGSTSRNWCYAEYATGVADASACARITETLNKVSCYYAAARTNRKPSLCNPISNGAWMRDCYSNSILMVEGGPVPSDCQFVENSDWKDKCFNKAAYATYNETLCSFIRQNTSDRSDCESAFGK